MALRAERPEGLPPRRQVRMIERGRREIRERVETIGRRPVNAVRGDDPSPITREGGGDGR
jgi:hypothetical protein